MSSKQLNFFIVSEDLADIYILFRDNGIKYIVDSISDINEVPVRDFPYEGKKSLDQIYLTKEIFKPYIYLNPDEKKDEYTVDNEKSYILEFDPGGFYPYSSKILHRARFYCKTSYFVSNRETVVKIDNFKSWVDGVFKLFKKEFLVKYGNEQKILISRKAIKWMEENNGKIEKTHLRIII